MQLLGDFPLFKPYTLPVCDLEVPAVTQKDWLRLPCLLCIKPNQPRGRFDWLKHKIPTSMAIFHAEEWEPTAMHQQGWFIIHIYTCSLRNIYTFTLFVYVLLLIYSPLAVFLIYVERFACCVFWLLSYSFFFLLTLWRDAPGKLVTKKNTETATPANFSKTCFGTFVFISLIYYCISVFL